MNYFEFFELPISLTIDEEALKKKFYANSRKYHPDFFATESVEKQDEMLARSSFNNEAYKTLSDFNQRVAYLLELKSMLSEEGKNNLSQSFLMEMMEVNETLMDLEFDFDPLKLEEIKKQVDTKEVELHASIEPLLIEFNETQLHLLKDYFLKKKYLLRIKENIAKFAAR